MIKSLISLLVLVGLCSLVASQACNTTHLQYFSQYSIGRQDELNKTFENISKVATIANVNWRFNDSVTYSIHNIRHTFQYLDSNQKARINENNTVDIYGGQLFVGLSFSWTKRGHGDIAGTGYSVATSYPLQFTVHLSVNAINGYLQQNLVHFNDVIFDQSTMLIQRIVPATISLEDFKNLQQLYRGVLNDSSVITVKKQLQNQIKNDYFSFLSTAVKQTKKSLDLQYTYQWNGGRGRFAVPLTIDAKNAVFNKDGYNLFYISTIKNYSNWKCEYQGPQRNQDPRTYGGLQQFLSYDVYKNVLKYGIERGQLDTILNRRNWQSKLFQFFAGDLYEVIPAVAKYFIARSQITGQCKTTTQGLVFKKAQPVDAFSVDLTYNCQLSTNSTKIADFNVDLSTIIQGVANTSQINFYVIGVTHSVKFNQYQQYKIQNEQLARHMVTYCIERLIGHRTFGSGWKVYDRDYPHFKTYDSYALVFDSSHIDLKTQ